MAFNWFKKKKKQNEDEATTHQQEGEIKQPINTVEAPEEKKQTIDAVVFPDETNNSQTFEEEEPLSEKERKEPTPAGFPAATKETASPGGLFARLKRGLAKTRDILTTDIEDLFSGKRQIDDDLLEELEELLITSDIGVQTATELITTIQKQASKIDGPEALKALLKQEIHRLLEDTATVLDSESCGKPHIVMVVGVNGVGKTTTIGKLAHRATARGKSVLIAAADTFRAAATDQLSIWAERAGADFVKHKENTDPAAVAFDGVEAALSRGTDIVFVDTAGRLHTKVNLMEELKKIKRAIQKKIPDAPHEVLLVLDATTGQNALSQAQLFHEAIDISALVLTKLDGTAKGGIVVRICQSMNVPLKYIGVGEGIEDLQTFDPKQFADALF